MKLLTKQEMLERAKGSLKTEILESKLWDGPIKIIELLSNEQAAYQESLFDVGQGKIRETLGNYKAKLVLLTVVDEANVRIFSDKDLDLVGNMPAGLIDEIYDVSTRLSGITKEAEEELVKKLDSQEDSGNSV